MDGYNEALYKKERDQRMRAATKAKVFLLLRGAEWQRPAPSHSQDGRAPSKT